MDNFIFDLMETYDYENIFFCQEKALGLKAIIVIHDTTLGPAAGGMRMWPYETEGMLRALGRFINRLGGLYLTGVDVGTTVQDMEVMRMESPYVVTIPESMGGPGDSAPATAFGVFQGIRACLREVYGSPLPQGRTVAVQGAGAVGKELVRYLVETGATVTIADIDQEKTSLLAAQYAVNVVEPEEIHRLDVDVYSPCAMGAILNDETIPELRCKIVCGSANNQLAEERHGDLLAQRAILYAR